MKDNEQEKLWRVRCNQNDKAGRDSSDERTEKRDHIGHSNNYADQQRVGHFENGKTDKTKDPDDQRINKFSYDKSTEYLVTFGCQMQDHICMGRLKKSIGASSIDPSVAVTLWHLG